MGDLRNRKVYIDITLTHNSDINGTAIKVTLVLIIIGCIVMSCKVKLEI